MISHRPRLYVVDTDMSVGREAEWAQWMQAAGMSRRTVEDRVQLLARFGGAADVDPHDADWQALAWFLSAAPSAGTRYTYYSHLRAWYRWLVRMGYRVDDPTMKLRAPRAPRHKPRPISLGQLDRILATPMHRRTRVMVLLAAYEGYRVSEIGRMRGCDISEDTITVEGKGGRTDVLPLHPLIIEAAETMPRLGYWFPSHVHEGRHVTGQSISGILGKVMRRADVRATPHALRHFFGTYVLHTSGGNLIVAKELMRHASVATTEGYTQIEDAARRAAIAALPVPPSARRWAA